ncbi:SRPBCC family protein [Lutibacter sp. TH_r2]|uniref:SRPBCC family protein n=1 Tax=Lutibacter sp. TH_r2 TaxID=3082083 RepID=UPI0029546A5B|nr:SRPBCC family protein [Lutibacter sp. TH_r2]MDV7187187.1 SRPBCC family protein [Lutibacter sp. TH_r2]
MNLESPKTVVNKSQKELFEFLNNLNNFEKIMPDTIQKFEVDGESFIFSLKGMPEIRLVLKEKQEFDKIILGAASSKLDFTLTANLVPVSENETEIQLLFAGDFNPMMAMMVKKPLQNFINTLTEKTKEL